MMQSHPINYSRLHNFLDRGEEIRLILTGKTGSGKSSAGNTILNREAFVSAFSPSSVTSECEKARGSVNGCKIAVIDTPGICDTRYTEEEVMRKLKMCLCLAAPGPHVFLIVLKLSKFTSEEQETVELLQQVFGEEAANYSLVLFTHGDQLKYEVEDFIHQSPELTYLIRKCNGRYHVFDNTTPNERQVLHLFAKIKSMIKCNKGTFYTNETFQRAERAIQEQAEKILMSNAEKKRREEENLRSRFTGKQLQARQKRLDEEFDSQSREKAEKRNKFFEMGMVVTSAEAGVAIGTAAGMVGGPVCMTVGAVAGGAIGAVVGLAAPTAVKALRKKCIMQ